MSPTKNSKFKVDHYYDPVKSRHYLHEKVSVLHCHHYLTLFTQLAEDAEQFQGVKLLKDAMEETFYPILQNYFNKNNTTETKEKISIVEDVWKLSGMGIVKFTSLGDFSASVEMSHSHMDAGWIKKWSQRDKPVNYVTQGYLSAAVAAINNNPVKSYETVEVQSIVSGADKSIFNIYKK